MSESFRNPLFGDHREPAAETDETGHPGVDAVLASLRGLDDLPVAEHVTVFEQAHESLRRTLAGAGPGQARDTPVPGRS